ncbi:hypothetical protein C8R43DRAFT_1142532 [Mycena crocata]|nr:hypothetical protein C8R43DRAFT_1142532 [Mycena crocata]
MKSPTSPIRRVLALSESTQRREVNHCINGSPMPTVCLSFTANKMYILLISSRSHKLISYVAFVSMPLTIDVSGTSLIGDDWVPRPNPPRYHGSPPGDPLWSPGEDDDPALNAFTRTLTETLVSLWIATPSEVVGRATLQVRSIAKPDSKPSISILTIRRYLTESEVHPLFDHLVKNSLWDVADTRGTCIVRQSVNNGRLSESPQLSMGHTYQQEER